MKKKNKEGGDEILTLMCNCLQAGSKFLTSPKKQRPPKKNLPLTNLKKLKSGTALQNLGQFASLQHILSRFSGSVVGS